MKFVALLSGGKDSCYNILKCRQHGHELIAVANLMPPDTAGEELNSFMYQSAAHCVIPDIAECLGVPIFRRTINGKSLVQTLQYVRNDEDEVEDLHRVLLDVLASFPDCRGVSCGAIVSTYQRNRVENICERLGLQPLTYMWQYDRSDLLDKILAAGIRAVLVKVAGAGLDPRKHLGKDLSALKPTLQRLHDRFGLDLCGEGGEYETLVTDCPGFKQRIGITSTEIILDEEDYTVGNLKILSWKLEPKEELDEAESHAFSDHMLPPLLSLIVKSFSRQIPDKFMQCIEYAESTSLESQISTRNISILQFGVDGFGQSRLIMGELATSTIADRVCDLTLLADSDIRQQTRGVMQNIQAAVQSLGAAMSDIVFVHLYLSDMRLFAAANAEYCTWFGRNPPSRCCISVPLPPGILVAADFTVLEHSTDQPHRRQTLHVRSISEWAPVCIGPYSQANSIMGALVCVAGQIPLDPATMTVWKHVDTLGPRHLILEQPIGADTHALPPCDIKRGGGDDVTDSAGTDAGSTGAGAGGGGGGPGESSKGNGDSDLGKVARGADELWDEVVSSQLLLSLRHAARILAVPECGSTLSRALCCLVYINMSQCDALLEGALSAGDDSTAMRSMDLNHRPPSRTSSTTSPAITIERRNAAGGKELGEQSEEGSGGGDNIRKKKMEEEKQKVEKPMPRSTRVIDCGRVRHLVRSVVRSGVLQSSSGGGGGGGGGDMGSNCGASGGSGMRSAQPHRWFESSRAIDTLPDEDGGEEDVGSQSESDSSNTSDGADGYHDDDDFSCKIAAKKVSKAAKKFWLAGAAPFPVLVVGVAGIPRDCLLEVELVAATNSLNADAFASSMRITTPAPTRTRPQPVVPPEVPDAGVVRFVGGSIGSLPSSKSLSSSRTAAHAETAEPSGPDSIKQHGSGREDAGGGEGGGVKEGSGIGDSEGPAVFSIDTTTGSGVASDTGIPSGVCDRVLGFGGASSVARWPIWRPHAHAPRSETKIASGLCPTDWSLSQQQQQQQHQLQQEEEEEVAGARAARRLLCSAQVTCHNRNVCAGFCEVFAEAEAEGGQAMDSDGGASNAPVWPAFRGEVAAAVELLVQAIASQLKRAEMSADDLRVLRVYYRPAVEGRHQALGGEDCREKKVLDKTVQTASRDADGDSTSSVVPTDNLMSELSTSLASLLSSYCDLQQFPFVLVPVAALPSGLGHATVSAAPTGCDEVFSLDNKVPTAAAAAAAATIASADTDVAVGGSTMTLCAGGSAGGEAGAGTFEARDAGSGSVLLAAHFMAVNLLQLRSDIWIHGD